MIKKAGLDARADIFNPKAHDNEVGRDAKDVDVATSEQLRRIMIPV